MAHLFEVLFDGFGGGMIILSLTIWFTIWWTNRQAEKRHTHIVRHSKRRNWLLGAVILAIVLIGAGVSIHFLWKPRPTPSSYQPVQTLQLQTTHQAQTATSLAHKRVANTSDEIVALLRGHLQVDSSEITPDKDLVLDLGADPIDKKEIMMALETSYGIEIPDKDAQKIKSVGDLIGYVKRKLKEKDGATERKP